MMRRIGILLFAMMFLGSMAWAPAFGAVEAAPSCQCCKNCQCEHCKTGKGDCACKAESMGCKCKAENKGACQCGKDCQCEHCKTGKGDCACKAGTVGCKCQGENKAACQCGKDCQCEHCKTGKGDCACKAGTVGCKCAPRADSKDAAPQEPAVENQYATTMVSKDGGLKVTYTSEPEAIPIGQIISWKLKVVTAAGEPVKDAEITVDGGMPTHGHGLPTMPKVTKNLGDGNYLVEGIKFSMPGWWIMTFTIKSGDKTDSVTFNLQLK